MFCLSADRYLHTTLTASSISASVFESSNNLSIWDIIA